MLEPNAAGSKPVPLATDQRLGPALAAMTGTQALVALALFAPGVLAPKLGLAISDVSAFAVMVFAVGMATSLYGGVLAQRFGACRVAAACAAAAGAGMLMASMGTLAVLVVAGCCVGMAFGPETPASSALLGRLASPAQRPLVFSVRQTGNQIGAIIGSLTLPLLAVASPRAGFLAIAALAFTGAAVLLWLSRRYDGAVRGSRGEAPSLRAAFHTVSSSRPLTSLALLSVPFSAMQLGLNAYLVSFAVSELRFDHVLAGILLAVAQAGGLVGRLFWGLVATRWLAARTLLIGIGVGMAVTAAAIALLGSALPISVLFPAAFLFGLTASGWNGVFLAEVARLAPAGRIAEATGGVLTASYAGLLLAPLVIATVANWATLSASYLVLAGCVLAGTLAVLRTNDD